VTFDLAARLDDVRRIAWRTPSFRSAVRSGHDPDDLLQEVYVRLLMRQRGRSAYDPDRGSFGRYVWIVVRSVIRNYRRDHRRPRTSDGLDPQGAPCALVELDRDLELAAPDAEPLERTVGRLADALDLEDLDRAILFDLASGHTRREIRERYGLPLRVRHGVARDRVCRVLLRARAYLQDEPEPDLDLEDLDP